MRASMPAEALEEYISLLAQRPDAATKRALLVAVAPLLAKLGAHYCEGSNGGGGGAAGGAGGAEADGELFLDAAADPSSSPALPASGAKPRGGRGRGGGGNPNEGDSGGGGLAESDEGFGELE